MAEGRMIKKRIALSKKLSMVKTDSTRLLYFMMYPHADIEGRLEADADVVRAQTIPLLNWKIEKVKECLGDLNRVGLICLYTIEDKECLQFTRFGDFQRLNPDREAKSQLPPYSGELQSNQDNSPQVKLSKVNISKDKVSKGCPFPFEELWTKYPNKVGRKEAVRHFEASIHTLRDFSDINKALENYLRSERVAKGFVMNASTFFNNWQDWLNYTEDICPKCKGKGKYTSTTGYEVTCDCPKGLAVKR